MLLSMVGEVNRRVHEGAEIAIALLSEPAYSVILRTTWRVRNAKLGPGLGNNRRPDFQELLTDVRLAVWVRSGKYESSDQSLAQRVREAFASPSSVSRFGGLSLGESTHLVNEIGLLRKRGMDCQMLFAEDEGDLSLPIWPDHVGSATTWGQYRLIETHIPKESPQEEKSWTAIRRTNR
jgi:CRISPR-associated protein Cas5t